MAASGVKKFEPNRQYKIGRVKAGNMVRLQWLTKPVATVIPGRTLIEDGCKTTADFWDRNPLNGQLKLIHTIAEIDPATQGELVFDTGSFRNVRVVPEGLADRPIIADPNADKLAPAMERMFNARIDDLKAELTKVQTELNAERTRFETERKEHFTDMQKLRDEDLVLKEQLKEAQLELKFLNEKVLPKYIKTEEDKSGLSDRIDFNKATAPFQTQLADKVIDRAFDWLEKKFSGNDTTTKTEKTDQPTQQSGMTSADLISEVD